MENRAIVLRNVSHSYEEKSILENVSLSVEEGEIFGLLGPSGAGKTTIINILTGQIKCTDGAAVILGESCERLSSQIHQQIGVMTDSLGLCERLSVYDNLAFFADLQGISRSRINDILYAVGLYNDRKKSIVNLSKGMKNRTSLARTFLSNNKIAFLDEPTSGLDPSTASEIHELIKEYNRNGCTIFMTTHNMQEAEELCTHIALLNKGKIIQYGTPKQICLQNDNEKIFNITLKSGESMVIANAPQSANVLYELLAQDKILGIHSSEPSLKEVFLQLSGGKMR